MKNIFLITILLTLSSCMVSTKVFDAAVLDLQKDCCKVKNDTINGKCKM